ncbi:MAG: hypothetical protein HYZ61_05260 [Candidatus Andersenbacteria bacterium]|nr:hypothetical protein [Candidatus Andersenbacteria bacterium]
MQSNSIAWIALVVALAALVLAVMIWNRPVGEDTDFDEEAGTQIEETTKDAALLAARAQAETKLAAIRAQVATKEGYENALQEAQEARSELAEAYRNASVEAQQEWAEVEVEFDVLEDQLRAKSADALADLDRLINRLRVDVQTDEND